MRSVVMDGLSPFLFGEQGEIQRELEDELVEADERAFNLKLDILDAEIGIIRVTEFDLVSNPDPKVIDDVLAQYQWACLLEYDRLTFINGDKGEINARIHDALYGEPTNKQFKRLKRTIKQLMKLRIKVGLRWPDLFPV